MGAVGIGIAHLAAKGGLAIIVDVVIADFGSQVFRQL